MPKQVTITEARDHLSAHIRSAEHGTPVVITRRGRAVAVIIAAEEFDQLDRLRPVGPHADLAILAGGWEGSEELVSVLDARQRTPSRRTSAVD